MRRFADAVEEDLHRFLRLPDGDLLADKAVGHAVIVLVKGDMIVRVHARLLPLGKLVGLSRQRRQGRFVQAFKQLPPRLSQMVHRTAIQLLQEFPDSLVRFRQAKEGLVAQPGQNPALDHLHAHLHFGFIFGLSRSCWYDSHLVVTGKLLVAGVDVRLVAVRALDPCFEIVRYEHLGHAP